MESQKFECKNNWLNVILNIEFLSFIDFYTIKEISLTSKLVRKKLESILFNSIELSDKVDFEHSPFKSYFEYLLNLKLDIDIPENRINFENDAVIEQYISNISSNLSVYKAMVNRFNLIGVRGLDTICFQYSVFLTI
jgi:hypothetical protein